MKKIEGDEALIGRINGVIEEFAREDEEEFAGELQVIDDDAKLTIILSLGALLEIIDAQSFWIKYGNEEVRAPVDYFMEFIAELVNMSIDLGDDDEDEESED